jgi:hypothetical protein
METHARAGLGLILRAAVLRHDLELLELALRLGADPESEDDQYRKCGGAHWAVEQAVHHGELQALLRVARTGSSLWHRQPRPSREEDWREVAAYSYALHTRIRVGSGATDKQCALAAALEYRPGLSAELESAVDPLGRTPLIYASEAGNSAWVADLLQRGVDIGATDADGWDALHAAAFQGHVHILEQLLKHADAKDRLRADRPSKDGRTALDMAQKGRYRKDPAVAAVVQQFEHAPVLKSKKQIARRLRCSLCVRLPVAAIHAGVATAALLWHSCSIYEVVWQLSHVERSLLRGCGAGFVGLLLYAGGLPWLLAQTGSPTLSQLGAMPVLLVLLGAQLMVVVRAMHIDPGAVGCRRTPSTPSSWHSKRELLAAGLEFLQHLSVSFAAEIYWNQDSQLDAFSQLSSLTSRRWLGDAPLPGLIVFIAAATLATAWVVLAGYLALTMRAMWEAPLRRKLPPIRADSGWKDRVAEGAAVPLLGTTAYMPIMVGLMRQLHCTALKAPIESLRRSSPDLSTLPVLWDDVPSVRTVCWESSRHIWRAEAAMLLLLLYQLTSCSLAPFFSQPRTPTVSLLGASGRKCIAQPGVRRSLRFDAIARLVKLVLAIIATFGRAQPSLTLAASLGGNLLLTALACTPWCRPTNSDALNAILVGCYGASTWGAVICWVSFLVAAPSTWGTVGLLLVGWVAGGVWIGNRHIQRAAHAQVFREMEE